MKNKKTISILLYSIGLSFILYPLISRAYYDMLYRQEAEEILKKMTSIETTDTDNTYEKQQTYNQTAITDLEKIEVADIGFVEDNEEIGQNINLNEADVLGVLSIPKIDLTYAIRDGATDENLFKGVARIEGTSYPVGGMNTNSVISGHSGLARKTFFSNLTQLEKGDLIQIQNKKETLHYEVFGTDIIEPTNVGALAVVPGQDMITLLTCTRPVGTHRYLVFAKRTEITATEEGKSSVTSPSENKESVLEHSADMTFSSLKLYVSIVLRHYGLVLGVFFTGILSMFLIYFKPKN